MLAVLATFAARYWKPVVLLAVLAAAASYRAILVHERDAARLAVSRLEQETAELKAANEKLVRELKQDNAAVAELKKAADAAARALAARTDGAARAGRAVAARAARQAQTLSGAKVEAGCAAAIRWGNERAVELSRW